MFVINFYTVKIGSGADDEAMDVYKSDVYVWLGCRTHPPTLKNGARAKALAQR